MEVTPRQDPQTASKRFVIGDRRAVIAEVVMTEEDEAVVPGDFGFDKQVDFIVGDGVSYDPDTEELTSGAEGGTFWVLAIGK